MGAPSVRKFESIAEGVLVLDAAMRITSINGEGLALLGGNDPTEIYGKTLWEVSGNGVDLELKATIDGARADQAPCRITARSVLTSRWYEIGIYPAADGSVSVSFRNVTDHQRTERTTAAQKRALEMAMSGAEMSEVLDFLVMTAEELIGGEARASILLVEDGHLKRGSAPSLPPDYSAAIDGVLIADGTGSCGTSAARNEPVLVTDIESDPLWNDYRALARKHGLRACWSLPVRDTQNQVLATFAIYHAGVWKPAPEDEVLMDFMAHTASTVIETRRQVDERRAAEAQLAQAQERLELALKAGSIGTFRWDMRAGYLQWDDRMPTLLGLPSDLEGKPLQECLGLVHPDDLPKVMELTQNAVDTECAFDHDFRVVWADGSVHWLAIRANTTRDPVTDAPIMAGAVVEITAQKRSEEDLREELRVNEILGRVNATLATELDQRRIVQAVTDAATEIAQAEMGAFFYNAIDENQERFTLVTLSGVPDDAFSRFPMPRNTEVFDPTFRGTAVLRVDDIRRDPRYGKSSPYYGQPEGHPVVASYLAIPVVSRSGEVHGGLFFGHSIPGRFTERHERHILGLASLAAIAVDNVRLYDDLRDSADRLSLTLDAADLGDWMWDTKTDVVMFSDRAAEIFGIPAGPYMTWTEMQRMLHDDDREATAGAVLAALENRVQYDVEYRVNRPDGLQVWVSAIGSAQYDAGGHVTGMYGVVADISARKSMEVQLRERAEALAEADRRKDEFLATLAHELRNPLAPLRSGLDLLQIKGDDSQALGTVHAMMERQVRHMVHLVDDLLDVSRITRGALSLRMEEVELATTVTAAVETAEPVITRKGHRFSLSLPDEPIRFMADPTRLAQILGNLLNNAAKYTPNEGRITLEARNEQGELIISVTDTGIGFDEAQGARLFDMFTQVHADQHSAGGLGIGLTLARRLVELHGGRLEAKSDGPGKGSQFSIRLPLPEHPLREERETANGQTKSDGKRRILVADDNVDAADLLKAMLSSMGHEVVTANDGAQALITGSDFKPDVVILDIGMPVMDGRETARRARQEDWGKDVLLIALTGWGQASDRHLTREAGFDQHLVKPVDMATLEKAISG